MSSFEESYLGQLRKLVGHRKLITPAASAVVRDDSGRVLLIRRRDNLEWAFPAGGMELDESVYDCVVREVKEETGLDVVSATLFAIYSGARFAGKDMWDNYYQLLIFRFSVDEWSGTLGLRRTRPWTRAFSPSTRSRNPTRRPWRTWHDFATR